MLLDQVELDPSIVGPNIASTRRRSDLTQAELAKRIGVSRPTLIALENGQRAPSTTMLLAIAEALASDVRELVALPPQDEHSVARFRDPFRTNHPASEALLALNEFGRAYGLMEKLGKRRFRPRSVPPLAIEDIDDIELAADSLATSERARLSLGDGPIADLRSVLEQDAGILVFGLHQLAATKIAGLFIYANDLGLVGFNLRQADARRQRWTLAHEYAHFLTNRFDAEITYIESVRKQRKKQEQFAEFFAASFLMPTSGLVRRLSELLGGAKAVTVAQIIVLANQFRVSFEAMCRRLESMGKIPRNTYEHVMGSGLKPIQAERSLGIERNEELLEPYPTRFLLLLSTLRRATLVGEGDIAKFLQTDRLSARAALDVFETDADYPIDEPLEK